MDWRCIDEPVRRVPDDLQNAVSNDEHLTSDFALAADEVSRREDVRSHLQYEVVQKFRLALVKYRHLLSTSRTLTRIM